MTIRSDVISAIRDRRTVELWYDDDAASREVEPHVLYRTASGEECVDAYQVQGPTHSGTLPDWRLFNLAKIRRLAILQQEFSPAPGYEPTAGRYRHGVIARV